VSRSPEHRDRGVATVLAAAAIGVIVVLLGSVLTLGEATWTRHRAESAADLAALAGAADAVSGTDVACGRAGEVARSNGAELTSCTWQGWAVTTTVTRPCGCLLSVAGPAVGRARAGPAAPEGVADAGPVMTPGDRPVTAQR
jgi:secretion/DNA translocation related TadE-like protein